MPGGPRGGPSSPPPDRSPPPDPRPPERIYGYRWPDSDPENYRDDGEQALGDDEQASTSPRAHWQNTQSLGTGGFSSGASGREERKTRSEQHLRTIMFPSQDVVHEGQPHHSGSRTSLQYGMTSSPPPRGGSTTANEPGHDLSALVRRVNSLDDDARRSLKTIHSRLDSVESIASEVQKDHDALKQITHNNERSIHRVSSSVEHTTVEFVGTGTGLMLPTGGAF